MESKHTPVGLTSRVGQAGMRNERHCCDTQKGLFTSICEIPSADAQKHLRNFLQGCGWMLNRES